MVGLGNVENTADASKPISTATQSALGLKAHARGNSKAIIGLDNVENTADANKPMRTATQSALD